MPGNIQKEFFISAQASYALLKLFTPLAPISKLYPTSFLWVKTKITNDVKILLKIFNKTNGLFYFSRKYMSHLIRSTLLGSIISSKQILNWLFCVKALSTNYF